MSKLLLVSLISAQTIPNLQLIKKFWDEENDHLFVVTNKVKDNEAQWLVMASGIQSPKTIEVDPEDFVDVQNKLAECNFVGYERIIVNITGGTKVMGISMAEFFKGIDNAEIYYITPKGELLTYFPELTSEQLLEKINLPEYLKAYGFAWSEPSLSGISFEQTKTVFENCKSIDLDEYCEELDYLRKRRGRKIKAADYPKVESFLHRLGYDPITPNELCVKETKYLTGEWFEEYVGLSIKEKLHLSEEELWIGTTITKNPTKDPKNNIRGLLGNDARLSESKSTNEMDVMFVHNNNFYSIECKSSIIAYEPRTITDKEGRANIQHVDKNILGETIYKSDSLQSRFGLYPRTFILTLTDFQTYWKNKDKSRQNEKTRQMEELVDRANLSNITLVDKSRLVNEDILSILGINAPC